MLTSAGQRGDSARCRDLGISAYLTKPIKQSDLFDAIVTVLALRSQKADEGALVTRHSLRAVPSALVRGTSRRLRILLAEDNEINQRLAMTVLSKWGHSVAVASNGREAVEAVERERFDLVLMDVQMPVLDGFEATGIIRHKESERGGRIPIVAMTAHALKGDREKCIAAGMDDYVSKPINKEALLAELNVYRRAQMLLDHLEAALREESRGCATSEYPPRFSAN